MFALSFPLTVHITPKSSHNTRAVAQAVGERMRERYGYRLDWGRRIEYVAGVQTEQELSTVAGGYSQALCSPSGVEGKR
jgi:hypothetical protein